LYKKKGNILLIKKGFTLIELLVTLAILSIVLILSFSMNLFGTITFNRGDKQSDIQSNLRNASNYITKELRYSSNPEILTSMPGTRASGKEYIYIDSDGSLKHYSGGNSKTLISNSGGITTTLLFQKQDYQTVYFQLQSTLKEQRYSIDSSALLLNIGTKVISGPDSGMAICFTAGEPMVSNVNTKPVTSITINAPSNNVAANGGTLQFTASVQPSDASNKTITWSVDNMALATINSSTGLLRTVTSSSSTAWVTATANDGSGIISNRYQVNIEAVATNTPVYKPGSLANKVIQLTSSAPQSISITDLKQYFSYSGSDLSFSASTSNGTVASVSTSGINLTLTGLSTGTATITVKATNAGGKQATGSFIVSVVKITIIPDGITSPLSNYNIVKGSSKKLKLTLEPSTTSYSSISWHTTNGSINSSNSNIQPTFNSPSGNGKVCDIYAEVTINGIRYKSNTITFTTIK
jgi:prepilin-type N-terminal cleavage/methylation domain-containing protein